MGSDPLSTLRAALEIVNEYRLDQARQGLQFPVDVVQAIEAALAATHGAEQSLTAAHGKRQSAERLAARLPDLVRFVDRVIGHGSNPYTRDDFERRWNTIQDDAAAVLYGARA